MIENYPLFNTEKSPDFEKPAIFGIVVIYENFF